MKEVDNIEETVNNMNVAEEIKKVCDILKRIDEYDSKVSGFYSTLDKKLDFWEHVIEFKRLSVSQIYRMFKEMKRLRTIRRKVKNDLEILSNFNKHRQKLTYSASTDSLLMEVCKFEGIQNKRRYSYLEYTEGEFQTILGGDIHYDDET